MTQNLNGEKFIDRVRDLIIEDKIIDALKVLKIYISNPLHVSQFTLIESRLKRINTENINGILTEREYNMGKNKIILSILKILDSYQKNIE